MSEPSAPNEACCPLCGERSGFRTVRTGDGRDARVCPRCRLIFVDARYRLSRADEAARYRTHNNSIDDERYVAFLSRVVDPTLPYLRPGMRGLDFGCGPGPTLSQIVRRHGIECDDYDPIFRTDPPRPPYDFVFATECLEHFHEPARELDRLAGLLAPGGYLGIMTESWDDLSAFDTWHYTRDSTHVVFYHEATFDFICETFGFRRLYSDGTRVRLLTREIRSGGTSRDASTAPAPRIDAK